MNDLECAVSKLKSEGASIVFVKDEMVVFQSGDHGIKPFIDAIHFNRRGLQGSSVADRIVGRAATLLSLYVGVSSVYALAASSKAVEVLKAHGIPCRYEVMLEKVLDREGKDLCPFERAVLHTDSPEEAFKLLEGKVYPQAINI